jgi:hypothetical protein
MLPTASAPASPFAKVLQSASQTAAASATQTTAANPSGTLFTTAAPSAIASTAVTAPAAQTATTPAAAAVQVQPPGIAALISAIQNGSFKPSNVTDPSKLQQVSPVGSATLSNFFYASDDTANQLAQLLGGKVVQMPPFGPTSGWTVPTANFIQLPNGQTVNAASLAFYAKCGAEGTAQLTADLTQDINEGAAWNNFYQNGGPAPSFAMGYTGSAISGMTYPDGTVAADGTVINPAMPSIKT